MKEKEMRFRIPQSIHDRYRVICIKMKLSVPKQTAALIRKFVEIQEDNYEKLNQGD